MPTPFSVDAVSPAGVDAVWHDVLPMVKRGLRHGEGDTITPEMIRACVLAGEMQMWVVHEAGETVAVVVFRIISHLGRRKLFVVMVAGRDIDLWADEVEQRLMDFMDISGATAIEASCRHGMAAYLEKRGWSRRAVIMRAPKRIEE